MHRLLSVLFILLTSFTYTANASEDKLIAGLEVENAWIAEAPPVSKVMVAYLIIRNITSEDIELVSAESELYSSIEFHETKHENGMARMIRHDTLNIPANSSLKLRRGGQHLMLFNPTKRLEAGDSVSIKFITKNDMVKTISVIVKKAQY